jgi:serine/threonine protein kinase
MEYMNAGSIQDMLNSGRTFDEDDAAVLAFSVLTALVELHSRNILHRDIKPSNILTDCAGRIKLSDFGVSKGMISIVMYVKSLNQYN